MSIGRFFLSLNHDDPKVVMLGLNDFRLQVIQDHDAVKSIGYNGRSSEQSQDIDKFLHPQSNESITGVLAEYIAKSPQIEELFVLWNLPGRDEDRALSSAHVACIAAVLHCAKSNANFCNSIVSRILCDHLKSLHSQLASGNVELIHSTLGLLTAMVRTSAQNCKDVFQKLNLSSQALDAVVQKGKAVTWKLTDDSSQSMSTDSRLLVIILVLLVLEAGDETAMLELFAERSLMRKVMHSVGRDSTETLRIVLPGVLHALQQNQILNSHLHDIFDGATVRQLVLLYAHKEESVQILVHDFLLQLVDHMSVVAGAGKRRTGPSSGSSSGASVSVSRCCAYIAQHLEPHSDSKQEEVLMAVLTVQPHLLSKSISSLATLKTWEPVASSEYLGIMRYLGQLLRAAGVDAKSKAQLRAAFAPTTSDSSSGEPSEKQNQQSVISGLVNSWIPPGLNKKDICKMLAHKELSLQKVGLQYVQAVVQRLQRVLSEAGISSHAQRGSPVASAGAAQVEHCVATAIATYLPDFQLLVNMRSKLVKSMNEKVEAKPAAVQAAATNEVADDFDFNIDGEAEGTSSAVQAEVAKLAPKDDDAGAGNVFESLYGLLLQVVETYLTLSPQSISQVKFDILRVLDDYVPWESAASSAQAQVAVSKLNPEVLLSILRVLRQATTSLEVRWFGAQDDVVKMLINLIVAEDWRGAVKRSVLAKLMLLAAPAINPVAASMEVELSPEMEEVAKRAKTLLKFVLIQSGLFVGHGLVDLELSAELNTWVSIINSADDSLLVVEPLLRMAHHWNTDLSILGAQNLAQQGACNYLAEVDAQGSSTHGDLLPYSPLLYCSMLLLSSNFSIFAALLPKHIRAHIPDTNNVATEPVVFFDKYNLHFRNEVQNIFGRVFCAVVGQARSPHAFARTVSAGLIGASSALASTDAVVESVAAVSSVSKVVTFAKVASDKDVALNRKTLQSIVDEIPAFADVFASAAVDPTTSSKKKKSTPAKSSSTKIGAALGDALDQVSRNPLHLAALCAAAVVHWESLRALLDSSDSPVHAQLSDLVNTHWKLIFHVRMSLRVAEVSVESDFYSWALEQWHRDVAAAEGLQSKACVLHAATQLLSQIALRVDATQFVLGADDNVLVQKATAAQDTATPSKSRKRSQSDLSPSGAVPASALSLSQAVVHASLSIAVASGSSPMIAALLSSSSMLASLCAFGWFGQWVRKMLLSAVNVAVRALGTNPTAKRAAQKSINGSPELVSLWMKLSEILVAGKLQLRNGSASAELQALALSLTKLVDFPALRALVVDSSVNTQSLVDLPRLEPLQGTAKDAPQLARLDTVLEDVLRSASAAQIASAVCAQTEQSPLSAVIFQPTAESAFYFDSASVLRAGDIASTLKTCKWSADSPQASSLLSLTQRNAQLAASVSSSKSVMSTQQITQALVLDISAPGSLRSGELDVLEAAEVLSQQWVWSSTTTAALVTKRIGEVVSEVTSSNTCGLSESGLPILTEAIALLSTVSTSDTLHVLVQYLAYLLQSSFQSGTSARNEVATLLLPIIAAHKLMRGPGIKMSLWAQWTRAFVSVLVFTIDNTLAALSELNHAETLANAKTTLWRTVAGHLKVLEYLMTIPDARVASSQTMQETLAESAVLLKKKLNKLVKSALKNGIENPSVLLWIGKLQQILHKHQSEERTVLVGSVLHPEAEDFYHPQTLFNLIPGHSKFAAIVSPARDHQHGAKVPLLKLILQLTLIVCTERDTNSKKKKVVVQPAAHYLLAEVLLSTYTATMSEADRITLRVLTNLSEAGRCPALCTLVPKTVGLILGSTGLRSADETIADSSRWMVEGITPPMAYSTLSRFPMWRSMASQPLAGLEDLPEEGEETLDSVKADKEWSGAATKSDADMDVENDEDNNDDYPERNEADEDAQAVFKSDPLLQCSDKILDPAFFLPAFFHVLRNKEVSIRQLANGGGLSLIIASLGSPCVMLRTCALACLQFVLNMVHQQNPTRDAAFRERAQLLLLLTYIRNAFDPAEEDRTSAPRLPLTTAVFLGRASMNVMQANHELFSRVNKYLLARPFCDIKDVPLYDLLLVNGDAQSDQMQRLSALRLFRDGLLTKQDHLNLCRKNAYNRLMLLFPLLAKDARAGHAVLDLLDKGLCLKVSARYLLERCRLAAWVKLLAAPMGAMQLAAKVTSSLNSVVERSPEDRAVDTALDEATGRSFRRPDAASHYSKYLVRAMTLLRRMIASAHLLSCEDAKAKVHLSDLQRILVAVANDAVTAVSSGYADFIPVEYFAQLLLCMWDISSVLQKSALSGAAVEVWSVELIDGLLNAISTKFGDATSVSRTALNKEELVISLLLLLKYSSGPSAKVAALLTHLQAVSQTYLLDAASAKGGVHAGALAVMHSSLGHSATSSAPHVNAPHGLFDKLSELPYYTNICHVLSAVLGSSTIGVEESDFQARFEFTWNVAASADFSRMQVLPTTLGRHFVLHSVLELLPAAIPSAAVEKDPLSSSRWALVMWNAFIKSSSSDCKIANLNAASVDRAAKQALSARQVVAELLSKSEAGENPQQTLISSLNLCVLAVRVTNSGKLFASLPEVAKSLKVVDGLLQRIRVDRAVDTTIMSTLRSAKLVWSLESIATLVLAYVSALVTALDTLAFQERLIKDVDAPVRAHLVDLSTRLTAVVATFQAKLDTTVRLSDDTSSALTQKDSLLDFIQVALKADKFRQEFTPAQRQLILCTGAAYIPHLAVRSLKKAPRGSRSSTAPGDYVDGVDDDADDLEEVGSVREEEGSDEDDVENEEGEDGLMSEEEGSSGDEGIEDEENGDEMLV